MTQSFFQEKKEKRELSDCWGPEPLVARGHLVGQHDCGFNAGQFLCVPCNNVSVLFD